MLQSCMTACALVEKPLSVRLPLFVQVAVYVVEPIKKVLEPDKDEMQPDVSVSKAPSPPT